MSYILDALQKSEQARLASAAAARHSLLPASGEDGPPPPIWRYALLAGLLLVNAVAMYRSLSPASPGTAPRTDAAATPPERVAVVAPVETVAPDSISATATAAEPPQPSARVVAAPREHVLHLAAPVAATPVAAPAAVAPAAEPTPSPRPEKAAAPQQPAPVAAGADIPKTLPPLAIAGYIRGAGTNEMVIVNDKLVGPGDEVEPGLKLEKILDDGAVFNYRGYRFKR